MVVIILNHSFNSVLIVPRDFVALSISMLKYFHALGVHFVEKITVKQVQLQITVCKYNQSRV